MKNLFKNIFFNKPTNPVNALVADYLRRVKNGEQVDYGQFIADNPEVAIELNHILRSELDVIKNCPVQSKQINLPNMPTRSVPSSTTGFAPSKLFDKSSTFIGEQIGEFIIEAELGQGGMAKVYKAWQESCKRHVALKTMLTDKLLPEVQLSRLQREAMVQAQLNHPSIVQLYTCALVDDVPYVAMELIPGGTTLQSLLLESGMPFEETRAARIILAIARALDYSHKKGIVHRDIKASNIMMDGDTPKLTDFGLAFAHNQELTRLTRSGELVGTLGYISPEMIDVCKGRNYETPKPQSDIYSLGATFYELLTCKLPFIADSPGELILKIMEKEPAAPAEHGVKISKEAEAICVKCLEKSLDKRYQSAAELIDDLERYLDGKSVKAPTVNWKTRRIKREISKRKMVLILSFLTLLSITALTVFTSGFNYRQNVNLLVENRGATMPGGEEYELGFLLKAVKDKRADTRVSAIIALSRQENKAATAALLEAANDPDKKVKFHLATMLLDSSNPVREKICEILLREPGGFVAAAAIRLAEQLDEPRFLPRIQQLSLSNEKVLRNYALKTVLSALEDNRKFVAYYFENGPQDGKIELLNYMLKGQIAPPFPTLINLLKSSNSTDEKELVGQVMANYSDKDYGLDHEKWNQWWNDHGNHWRARHCLVVTWAPQGTALASGDLIWSVNGKETLKRFDSNNLKPTNLEIIRGQSLLNVQASISTRVKYRVFFVGTLSGLPVGKTSFIDKISSAITLSKSFTD